MFKIPADLEYVLSFFLFLSMSPNHFSCLEMILPQVFVLFCCFFSTETSVFISKFEITELQFCTILTTGNSTTVSSVNHHYQEYWINSRYEF